MKSTSIGYQAEQASNLIYPVRKVELLRRLADGSGWEASSIDITTEVVSLDRLAWKLDTDALNEFKTSNINIQVDNSNRQWDDASPSRFAGFSRFNSKIRISLGLAVSGSPEIFSTFTGIIQDALEDSATPTLKLDVRSLDQILGQADADNAAILVANELLGIGDGVTSIFALSQTPVGIIKQVRVAGVPVKEGLIWKSSGLNDPSLKATVNFNAAQPGPGQDVRADYIVWKQNQEIQQVVNDLLASVPQIQTSTVQTARFNPPAQRNILHTNFGDFSNYFLARAVTIAENPPAQPASSPTTPPPPPAPTQNAEITIDPYDSQTKWQAALNISRINFKRIPGGIHPLWTAQYEADLEPAAEKYQIDGDPALPWQELLPSNSTASNSGSIRNIVHNDSADYFLLNQADDGGVYQPTPYPARAAACRLRFAVLNGTVQMETYVRVSSTLTLGALLQFTDINHVRVVSGGNNPKVAVDMTQFHSFLLVMTPTSATAATYRLFIDGVSVQTGTLGSQSTISSIALHSIGTNNIFLDWIRYNAVAGTPAVGQLTLKVDYGQYLEGLVNFSLISTLGPFFTDLQGLASGVQFFLSWSTDDFTYSPETSIALNGNIGQWSNTNSPRYIKLRIVLTDTLEPIIQYGIKRLWLPALAVSPELNGGQGIVSWDTWQAQTLLNGGTVQFFTASVYAITQQLSFYQALGSGNTIQSDKFQKAQGFGIPQQMVFIALLNTTGTTPPDLLWSLITLTTASVLISVVNLGGRTVLDVLKDLAQVVDFEFGFDGNGLFFFRSKSPAPTSLLTFNDANLEQVQRISPGWDRVYNSIQVSFGGFVAVADSTTEGDPAPTSIARFGLRTYSPTSGQILFEQDVDLATVIAKRYFANYKEPKRSLTIVARFMPELELGDRVSFSLFIPRQIGQSLDARIIGIAHDLMNFRSELDLREV